MHPYFEFDLGSFHFHLPAMLSMMGSAAIGTFLLYGSRFCKALGGVMQGWMRVLGLFLAVIVSSFLGGRVFHALIENPILLNDPLSLLMQINGLVFYGALLFGGFFFLAGVSFWTRNGKTKERLDLFDMGAQCTALAYGWIRLGCFFEGCCWGKISNLPWSVTYIDIQSSCPLLGLPLHPTQIYDALLGFLIFGVLLFFYNKEKYRGWGLGIFLVLYSLGRFFTEFYRGDRYRGVYGSVQISTSQIISIFLLLLGVLICLSLLRRSLAVKKMIFAASLCGLLFVLSGCFSPPQSPSESIVRVSALEPKLKSKSPQKIEFVQTRYSFEKNTSHPKARRGVILVISHEILQDFYQQAIEELSEGLESVFGLKIPVEEWMSVSIEQLVWRILAPELQKIYSEGELFFTDSARFLPIQSAFKLREKRGIPYDAYFFTHGLSRLYSTGHRPILTQQNLRDWISEENLRENGNLKKLDLVFSSACFGGAIAQSWLLLGAHQAVYFSGGNFNIFWGIEFIRNRASGGGIDRAIRKTNRELPKKLHSDPLYSLYFKSLMAIGEKHPEIGKIDLNHDSKWAEPPHWILR